MMWSDAQTTIVKKDFQEALSNRMIKAMMIIVPIVLVVLLPGIFTVIALNAPDDIGEFGRALKMLPIQFSVNEMFKAGYYFMMNYLCPAYFVLVPIMSASVAAASSVVGEKERRTIETLLFSPLTTRKLYVAKIVGAMSVALLITWISFAGFLIVAIIGSVLVYGSFVLNPGIWLSMLFLVVPSLSLIAVSVMVFASARAKTFQEAQQFSAILIVPVMLLFLLPQISGLFLLSAMQMALCGVGLWIVALVLVRFSSALFTPEKLL